MAWCTVWGLTTEGVPSGHSTFSSVLVAFKTPQFRFFFLILFRCKLYLTRKMTILKNEEMPFRKINILSWNTYVKLFIIRNIHWVFRVSPSHLWFGSSLWSCAWRRRGGRDGPEVRPWPHKPEDLGQSPRTHSSVGIQPISKAAPWLDRPSRAHVLHTATHAHPWQEWNVLNKGGVAGRALEP